MREYCVQRRTLERWVEEAPRRWSEPFHKFLQEELSLARAGEPFPAFEFLLPAVDPLEQTLFDYLRGYRLVLSDRETLESTLDKFHAELYERFLDRVEPANRAGAGGDLRHGRLFRAALDRFPHLQVEELSTERREEIPPLFLSSQRTRKYHGNVKELVADLRKFLEAGERVAFSSPTWAAPSAFTTS